MTLDGISKVGHHSLRRPYSYQCIRARRLPLSRSCPIRRPIDPALIASSHIQDLEVDSGVSTSTLFPVHFIFDTPSDQPKMTTLHPSNPYYAYSAHLDKQNEAILAPYEPKPPQPQRSASISSIPPSTSPQRNEYARKNVAYRTRSIGGPFSTGVYFERQIDLSPPNDEEIIIATVRVTNSFRRASVSENSELPERPPARGFIRRLSSRINGTPDADRYTAIKMPRKDYKAYFARDRNGNYAGTEPEREWTQEQLDEKFGEFQDMPLRSIPGASEYGEGDGRSFSVSGSESATEAVESTRVWNGWSDPPAPPRLFPERRVSRFGIH
jgi:hypothetical protein